MYCSARHTVPRPRLPAPRANCPHCRPRRGAPCRETASRWSACGSSCRGVARKPGDRRRSGRPACWRGCHRGQSFGLSARSCLSLGCCLCCLRCLGRATDPLSSLLFGSCSVLCRNRSDQLGVRCLRLRIYWICHRSCRANSATVPCIPTSSFSIACQTASSLCFQYRSQDFLEW